MTEQGTATAPAGWYPDTTRPGQERYWTGQAWGAETRPLGFVPTMPVLAPDTIAPIGRRKKRKWPWIVSGIVVVIIVMIIIATAANGGGDSGKVQLSEPPASVEDVEPVEAEPVTPVEQFDLQHPHPAGYVATVRDLGENDLYTMTARLVEADATATIANTNQFNELPPAGFKYTLVEYTITGASEKPVMPGVESFNWHVVTENGAVAPFANVVTPGENIIGAPDLYAGQTYVGQVVYTVPAEAASFTFSVFGLYIAL